MRREAVLVFVVSRNSVSSTLFVASGEGRMEIGIIGAGNVGAALATGWKRAGHSIILGLRDAGKHVELIERTGARALSPVDAYR